MGKYILRRFILRAGICCAVCLVLLFHMSWYMFLCPQYHYGNLVNRLLSWNLRELGNYPEHQIIYVKPEGEFGDNMHDWERAVYANFYVPRIEVGVYPYLDRELENRIRALGYPFDFYGITYVGTDNYDDIHKAVPWNVIVFEDWVPPLISPDAEIARGDWQWW